MTLTNSTISGNTANDGGGIYNSGQGTVTLTNSTISDNTASGVGGGIFAYDGSTVSLANALIAGNTASIRPDCRGVLTSLGHNLIGDTTGCSFTPATGDLVNVDPMLGLIQDNGGPTFTHALLHVSPAIDAGDDLACPEADQRGVERPADGNGDSVARCDMGAYEFVPGGAQFPPGALDQGVITTGDEPVIITLQAIDPNTGDTLTYTIVSSLQSGNLFEGVGNSGDLIITGDHTITGDTVTYIAQAGFVGSDSFTFKANDGQTDSNVATVTVTVTQLAVTCNGLDATIVGTDGDDVIVGTVGADVIAGLGGDDVILGLGGNDTICGGDGDDTIVGGDGNDRIWGGAGEDMLRGGRGKDRLYGGAHDDILKGCRHNDRLYGEKGNDTLVGGKGKDRLFGQKGDDGLFGRAGNDSHNCGRGYDWADGGSGTDTATLDCESTRQIP